MRTASTVGTFVATAALLGLLGCPAHGSRAQVEEPHAEPPRSPRLAALANKLAAHERGAEDAFWRQLAAEGAPIVEPGDEPGHALVTFVWRGTPATRHVQALIGLAADQSALARLPGSNVFALSLSLPDTTRLTYAFAVDGDLHPDPFSKHPCGPMESLLELPRAPAQPWIVAHRGVPAGTLWHHAIRAATPGQERQLFVYTPPGHSLGGPEYPLLVAFDAEAMTTQIPLPLILDELIAAKQIPPVVALLIGNVDRSRELMPNPAFADLVALDLVPWMRERYRATSDPQRIVVSGSSRGGLAAAYAAFRHPEVYGNVLAQSGAFWWAPGFQPSPGNLFGAPDGPEPEALARDFAKAPRLPLRIWMEAGAFEAGQRAASRHLRDVLVARDYDVSYGEFAGNHSYASWRGSIADGLISLFATPPTLAVPKTPAARRPPIDIAPPTRSSRSWLVRTALLDGGDAALAAAKPLLTANPEGYALDEGELDAAGGTLLLLGRPRDALPLLRWNAERFPGSANAWDSLAWAYYAVGDRPRAAECFKRELALAPDNAGAASTLADLSAPLP